MKWEYCELNHVRVGGIAVIEDVTGKKKVECNNLAIVLDDLGQEGWEMVGLVDGISNTDTTVFYFKRPARIRILLVDRRKAVRDTFKRVLESEGDVLVIDETGNGRDAVDLFSNHLPDLMLADINLHEIDGITAADLVQKRHRNANVLIMGVDEEMQTPPRQTVESGARIFLSTTPTKQELLATVRSLGNRRPAIVFKPDREARRGNTS